MDLLCLKSGQEFASHLFLSRCSQCCGSGYWIRIRLFIETGSVYWLDPDPVIGWIRLMVGTGSGYWLKLDLLLVGFGYWLDPDPAVGWIRIRLMVGSRSGYWLDPDPVIGWNRIWLLVGIGY